MAKKNEVLDKFVEWAYEKKGEDIVCVDVREKSSFTDYFVLCSGNGELHTKAIANNILDKARVERIHLLGKEGLENAKWILLDFNDVIVHIFDSSVREYYQLEKLWEKMPLRNETEQE